MYVACGLLCAFLTSGASFPAMGANPVYPVSNIPAALKDNARAVIRYEEQVLKIKSARQASLSHSYAITILNENGLRYALFMEGTDRFRHVSNIRGVIYDAAGKKVEQLIQERIIDHSAIASINLYDDNRVLYFEPRYRTYPFTVVYQYEVSLDGFNNFPSWEPCRDVNISVQKSLFRVVTTDSTQFRYHSSDPSLSPVHVKNPEGNLYTWQLENFPAKEAEPFAGAQDEFLPVVYIAPNAFSMDGYEGNQESWQAFGTWISLINTGRNQISEEKKAFITNLVKDSPSERDKAERIYRHFQETTRYVSIQIGIGGWQPMKASEVERLGYGDCKALANYLQTLFSAGGLRSFYTLVLAGTDAAPVIPEFPSQQFNHAILCLQLAADTLWVECTDQKIPFGYPGTFTDDRQVLVISDAGGKLVRTPRYDAGANRKVRKIEGKLDDAGNLTFSMNTGNTGAFFDDAFVLVRVDAERQKKMTYSTFAFPGIMIDSFAYRLESGSLPAIRESVHGFAPRYGTLTADRMLISFSRLFETAPVPRKVTDRKSDVCIRRDLVKTDTILFVLPPGFTLESLPEERVVESPYGICSYHYSVIDSALCCIKQFTMKKGNHAPETYPELLRYLGDVTAADNQKACLKKKPL
jgi:hypothetical protein